MSHDSTNFFFFPLSWPEGILREVPIGFGDSIVRKAVVSGVDKEGTHVVMLSANLEFAIWDIDSVLTLARVTMEDESLFTSIEGMSDLLVFAEEGVLFKCSKVALTLSGFLGFILDELWFI